MNLPKISLDEIQQNIDLELKNLASKIEDNSKGNFITKIFSKKKTPKSLYIYGDVGRGKSMLVKDFFNSITNIEKGYFHFNDFMNQIHQNLKEIRDENEKYEDELIQAVKRIVKNIKLICFDEFQVVDIADAMLLSRIFSFIFEQEILVVFTSNVAPKNLYKNGLQRERFLKFIDDILLKKCKILHLDSTIDYRKKFAQNLERKFFIKGENEKIEDVIKNFTRDKKSNPKIIKIWGREIAVKKAFNNIAIFDFAEICLQNYAACDYQAIAKNFDLIFLLNVPILNKEDVNEARRFVLLIDEIYENKTALIASFDDEINKIYADGIGAKVFTRAVSRLNEISSEFYWQNSKLVK